MEGGWRGRQKKSSLESKKHHLVLADISLALVSISDPHLLCGALSHDFTGFANFVLESKLIGQGW